MAAEVAPDAAVGDFAWPLVWLPADAGPVIDGFDVEGLTAALLTVVAALGRTWDPADAADVGALAAGTENSLRICLAENLTGLGTG